MIGPKTKAELELMTAEEHLDFAQQLEADATRIGVTDAPYAAMHRQSALVHLGLAQTKKALAAPAADART